MRIEFNHLHVKKSSVCMILHTHTQIGKVKDLYRLLSNAAISILYFIHLNGEIMMSVSREETQLSTNQVYQMTHYSQHLNQQWETKSYHSEATTLLLI